MEQIVVSVICLTYNHELYIRQALDSILMQKTNFAYEILVGEDCSPDNSRQILKEYEVKYPDKFRMFYRENNWGATKNVYDLSMSAKGKYIALLELDDYWTDEYKLQKQVDFLEENPEYIGVAHQTSIINENEKYIGTTMSNKNSFGLVTLKDFLKKGFTFQSASLMYKNFYIDGQDYSILYKAHDIVGDLTVNLILLSRSNIFVMNDNMSCYRKIIKKNATNASSISISNRIKDLYSSVLQCIILEKYFDKRVDLSNRTVYVFVSLIYNYIIREKTIPFSDISKLFLRLPCKTKIKIMFYIPMFPLIKCCQKLRENKCRTV